MDENYMTAKKNLKYIKKAYTEKKWPNCESVIQNVVDGVVH